MADIRAGAYVALAGAAIALLSVFLPMAESSSGAEVVSNTLIQHEPEGLIVIVLAIGAALLAYRGLEGRRVRPTLLVMVGLVLILLTIGYATSDLLTLRPAVPPSGGGVLEELSYLAASEKADPGIGIYAMGLGGAATMVGALMMRSRLRQQAAADVAETPADR